MVGDIGNGRAAHECTGVVPADRAPWQMVTRVESVAFESSEVEAADRRQLVVDDHELLVMAVHRPLAGVECVTDARAAYEPVECLPHLTAVGMEERQRCAGPGEHAHLNTLCRLCEDVPQRATVVTELELRREVPAGEVDVAARALD